MTEVIGQWLSAVLIWAAAIPVQGWAILLGILLGGVVTQWVKRTIPVALLFPNWSAQMHVVFIRVLALVSAFIPAYIIWPDDQYELWAALAVGFTTPSIYRIASFFAYKRWPELSTKWSGTK